MDRISLKSANDNFKNVFIVLQQPVVVSTPTTTEPRSFMHQVRRFEYYIRTGIRNGED